MDPVFPGNLYVLDRLDTARRGILPLLEEMPACRAKVEKLMAAGKAEARDWYDTLNAQKEKLLGHLETCRLSLAELGEDALAAYSAKLSQAVAAFAVMTPDYGKFTALLKDYLQRLPGREAITTNAGVIGRLMNNVRMGYYPTDPDHVKMIARGIAFPPGVTTNLLDPCCGCGTALRLLATGNNCVTYGAELDESRAEEAQTRLHRIAVGNFFFSRISHVFAGVVEEGRITPESKMYCYPFSNVRGYRMCTGGNTLPGYDSLHGISSLPYLILSMPNNDDYYSAKNNREGLEFRDLLEHLKDKDPGYYYTDVLIPNGDTLKDFITLV